MKKLFFGAIFTVATVFAFGFAFTPVDVDAIAYNHKYDGEAACPTKGTNCAIVYVIKDEQQNQ